MYGLGELLRRDKKVILKMVHDNWKEWIFSFFVKVWRTQKRDMPGLLLSSKGTIQFERRAESRLEPWTVPADADKKGPYLVTLAASA
jgi:hypothetical protein